MATLENEEKRALYDQLGPERYEQRDKMGAMYPEFKMPKTCAEWCKFCCFCWCFLCICLCFSIIYKCAKCCGLTKKFDAWFKKEMEKPEF